MKRSHIFIASALTALSLASCSDFLDTKPLANGTDAIYYENASQFEAAANGLYNIENWKGYDGKARYNLDGGTDITGFTSNGGGSAGESDGYWDKCYSYIRNCNVVLEKAKQYKGDQKEIANSVGTAYFFRAWQHFILLQRFGGVPIADHVFDVTDPSLYGPRKSRYEVVKFILDDLNKAIELLNPVNASKMTSDKVNKQIAQAFLARVTLYEATWEKYTPSINYDLDGDGSSKGAGKTKPKGYPTIQQFFTMAKDNAKTVMENNAYSLWDKCDSLSYYYLFNIDDKGGNISNYKNLGKNTNKEFIFSVKYDYDVKRIGINLGWTVTTGANGGMSTQFGESFLCRNGLPIRLSRSANINEAYNNPQFDGWKKSFAGEFRNRDYRFVGCTDVPDRVSWRNMAASEKGPVHTTNDGKPYADPVYPKPVYDKNDPAFNSVQAIFNPTVKGGTHSGYSSRKFNPEGNNRADKTESPDWPVIRLAEMYLIYAEATCELGNGTISDNDLNISINKLRARAGVAPLTNALISGLYDADAYDYAQGKTVCKKLTMLGEIRRERACELFGEGFRMDDLKRWGIANDILGTNKDILGRHLLNTAYTTHKANDKDYHGQWCFDPATDTSKLLYGLYDKVSQNNPDYGRTIAAEAKNLLFTQRDFLSPIPLGQIRLNAALKQNPGW